MCAQPHQFDPSYVIYTIGITTVKFGSRSKWEAKTLMNLAMIQGLLGELNHRKLELWQNQRSYAGRLQTAEPRASSTIASENSNAKKHELIRRQGNP